MAKQRKSSAQIRSGGIALIVMALVLVVAGGVAFFAAQRDLAQYEAEGARDFNLLSPEELEGKPYVHGYVEAVFEVYAEEYTTMYGVRSSDKSDKLYYLIPILEDGHDPYFLSIEATPDYYSALDSIYDWTWDYETTAECPELYLEDARIAPLSSDMKDILYDWCVTGEFYENGSFVDWCIEYDFLGTNDVDELLSHVLPYMIVPHQEPGSTAGSMLAVAGAGVILLILGILLLAKAKAAKTAEAASVASSAFDPAPAAPAPQAPAPAVCANCGAALETGRDFCPNCGAKAKN